MSILALFHSLVGAITAAFLAISGATVTPQTQTAADVSSSTDAVVLEVAQSETLTPDTVTQAYELGKAVGRLEATAEKIEILTPVPFTSEQEEPMQNDPEPSVPVSGAAAPEPSVPAGVGTAEAPVSQARIEIVSPIAGKGLGRSYKAAPEIVGEENYLEIGAIVYDDKGEPTKTAEVLVTATDAEQDKHMVGTGNVMNVYVDGQKRQVPVYSFHYEFRDAGEHTITFTANGMNQSVTVSVQ